MLQVELEAAQARRAHATQLAALLQASSARTLALVDAYAAALGPQLQVPHAAELNPPLWELGHIAWFQEFWLARNQQRLRGADCDPAHARAPSRLAGADALYDSSHVAHSTRWGLPLPDLLATRSYLQAVLDGSLELLDALPSHLQSDDSALYFFRLVLLHQDMHAEAAVHMAQTLGIPLGDPLHGALLPAPTRPAHASQPLRIEAQTWRTGWLGSGFAFDNELGPHELAMPIYEIDSQPVCWANYLAFLDDGGYAQQRLWSPEGWAWRCAHKAGAPRYLRRASGAWQCQRFGQWQALDMQAPAVHLTRHEALAWCAWAGRVLPTEAQWECAALTLPGFHWGQVWEWTASAFTAYPGFAPHPYRDYSQPWFGSHAVLRGASAATAPRMAHPRYRNFFLPERNDVHAGFRSARLV